MKRQRNNLPSEEWAFFAKERNWLIDETQHCWICDEEVEVARHYEYTRENFRRGGEIGGYGLKGTEFKLLMEIPYVSLTDDQKDLLNQTERESRGVFGDNSIMIRKWDDPPNEWVYPLFINWTHKDSKLIAAFNRFLLKNRSELSPPEKDQIGGSGRKTSDRDLLKYLATYLLKKLFGQKKSDRGSMEPLTMR